MNRPFIPKPQNIVTRSGVITEGVEFLFAAGDHLMIAEARDCECGAQCYVNAAHVMSGTNRAALHRLPIFDGTVEECVANDDGTYACTACWTPTPRCEECGEECAPGVDCDACAEVRADVEARLNTPEGLAAFFGADE